MVMERTALTPCFSYSQDDGREFDWGKLGVNYHAMRQSQ